MDVNSWLTKGKAYWNGVSRQHKIRFFMILAVSIGCFAVLLSFVLRENYATVFSGLSPEDSGLILEELENLNIKAKLEDGGTAIAVPQELADRARVELAQAGLPRYGTYGWEIFKPSSWPATERELELQQKIALESELQRTLLTMPEVSAARVHLTIPKDNPFITPDDKEFAEASVVLTLMPGGTLSARQVQGIVHMVSHAVDKLPSENVFVMDQSMNILSNNSADGNYLTGGQVEQRMAVQTAYARQMENSVMKVLEAWFGWGNVRITVNAAIDFDQLERNQHLFTPTDVENGTGIVREIDETKHYTEGNTSGGLVGTDPNDPNSNTYIGSGTDESTTKSETNDKTIKYEINEIVETLVKAPGNVQSLSVAVVVNREEDLTPEETQKLQELVSAAVGGDDSREDNIFVTAVPFGVSDVVVGDNGEQGETDTGWLGSIRSTVTKPIVIGMLATLVAVLFILMMRRKKTPGNVVTEGMVATVDQQQDQTRKQVAAAVADEEVSDVQQIMTKKFRKLARQNPEDFAALIKAWLAEDRG